MGAGGEAGVGDGLGAADHGGADGLERGAAAAVGEVDDDAGALDGGGDAVGVADVAAVQGDAGIVEDGGEVGGVAGHDGDALAGAEEGADDVGADEAGAAEDGDVGVRCRTGDCGARLCRGEGGVAEAFAEGDEAGAEGGVEFGFLAAVECGVEGGDAGLHAEEEGVAAGAEFCGRQAVVEDAADAVLGDGGGGAQAGEGFVDGGEPAGAVIGEDAVGEDVGGDDAVVADDLDLPEREVLADGEAELGGEFGALQRGVDGGDEGDAGRDLDGGAGEGGEVGDGAGEGGDLGERVDGLFEEDVAGLLEHPVAELAEAELAEGDVVGAPDEAGVAEAAGVDGGAEAGEGGVVDEVLVHAERGAGGVDEALCRRPVLGEGFFEQDGLAGGEEREGDLFVAVGRDQDVGAVEEVGGDGRVDRGVGCGVRSSVGAPGQGGGGGLVRVDDRGDLVARQGSQGVEVHAGDIARADETDPAHTILLKRRPDPHALLRERIYGSTGSRKVGASCGGCSIRENIT